ncbi:MAG: hypothetical protein K0S04_73 [Herbinix sp.]|jgi:hypothetical protein|nr:hypothetical protein [Herbinix sp.]
MIVLEAMSPTIELEVIASKRELGGQNLLKKN